MHRLAVAVLALDLFLAVSPATARGAGVYEDAAGTAGFLVAPQRASTHSTLTRTNAAGLDASIFTLDATFPVRSWLLLQVEQPFVALSDSTDIRRAFGDLAVRARARLAGGGGRMVALYAGWRTGSGSTRVFPYASQSFDLELGLGYVDTLATVDLWALATGVSVKRRPEGFPGASGLNDFARLNGGAGLRLGGGFSVRAGASDLLFRGGAVRTIYFGEVGIHTSPPVELRLGAHVETARRSDRVSDSAIFASVYAYF